jgi:hypothetical protein
VKQQNDGGPVQLDFGDDVRRAELKKGKPDVPDRVRATANKWQTPAELFLGMFANMVDALLIDSVNAAVNSPDPNADIITRAQAEVLAARMCGAYERTTN